MGIIKIILTKIYRGKNVINLSKPRTIKIGEDINKEPDPLKANIKKITNKCHIEFALNLLTSFSIIFSLID